MKLVVASLIVVGCAAPQPVAIAIQVAPPPPVPPIQRVDAARYAYADATPLEQQLFAAINDARGAARVPVLAWNDQVSFIAHNATSPQLDFGHLAFAVSRSISRTPTASTPPCSRGSATIIAARNCSSRTRHRSASASAAATTAGSRRPR